MKKIIFSLLCLLCCVSCSATNTNNTGGSNGTSSSSNSSQGDCNSGYTEQSNKFFSYCLSSSDSSDFKFLAITSYDCKSDSGSKVITSSNQSTYKNATITKLCLDGVCPAKPDIEKQMSDISSSTKSVVLYLKTSSGKTTECTMEE